MLARGAVVKLSSALKFRTNWFYVLFVSSRSGRTLAGYVLDSSVRKLNSTIKVVDLTPAEPEIADPREFDLTADEILISNGASRKTSSCGPKAGRSAATCPGTWSSCATIAKSSARNAC